MVADYGCDLEILDLNSWIIEMRTLRGTGIISLDKAIVIHGYDILLSIRVYAYERKFCQKPRNIKRLLLSMLRRPVLYSDVILIGIGLGSVCLYQPNRCNKQGATSVVVLEEPRSGVEKHAKDFVKNFIRNLGRIASGQTRRMKDVVVGDYILGDWLDINDEF